MAITILLHIENEDPIVGEIESLPGPEATSILVTNPRQRDGKDLRSLAPGVVAVIYPMRRINFIELTPTEEEDQLVSFVRE